GSGERIEGVRPEAEALLALPLVADPVHGDGAPALIPALEDDLGGALHAALARLLAIAPRMHVPAADVARGAAAHVADLREEGIGGGESLERMLEGISGSEGREGVESELAGVCAHHVDVVGEALARLPRGLARCRQGGALGEGLGGAP